MNRLCALSGRSLYWHFVVAALVFVSLQVCAGCGNDVGFYKPSVGEDPFLPLTSPENVLHNLALSYNLRDCEHFGELLCDGFVFVFNQDDVERYPDRIPHEGFWGRDEERAATCHMFDVNWNPGDPSYKADDIELYLQLSGTLVQSNFDGAPEGTLEGFATLDLKIEAGGGWMTLLVQSRPRFYFAPHNTKGTTLWCLWRCEDAPFFDGLLDGLRRTGENGRGHGNRHDTRKESASLKGTPAPPITERASWGSIKSLYR
jgi:hypothetical protein